MALHTVDFGWWLLAVVCYGVGDYATTVVATRKYAIIEANPVVRRLLSRQPGPIGFAILKIATLAVTFAGYLVSPTARLRSAFRSLSRPSASS
jgi:hypothetical protein